MPFPVLNAWYIGEYNQIDMTMVFTSQMQLNPVVNIKSIPQNIAPGRKSGMQLLSRTHID